MAGDEFEPLNPLALKATGFLGAGVFPTQITKNEVERTRYDALDDMAATTGTAFLGLTVGCARCHDHKFDPIPQADYYRLVSTFTTTVRSNVDVVVDREAWEMRLAEWNAAHQPLVQQLQRFDQTELPTRFVEWDKQPRDLASRPKWITPTVTSAQTKTSSQLTPQSDGSVLLSDATDGPETFTLVVQTRLPKIQTVRIEALRDESARYFGFGAGKDGDFVLSDVTLKAASLADSKQTRDVKWGEPRATAAEEKFPAKGASDGDKKTGWSVSRSQTGNHALVIELVEPIEFEGGCQLTCTLGFQHANGHPLVRPRISVSDQPLPGEQEPTLPLLGGTIIEVAAVAWGLPAEERTAEQTAALQGWFAGQLAERNELLAEIDRHLAARPESNLVTMMICSEGVKPIRHHTQGADFFEQTFFLKRGDCDQKEGVAQQRFLQVLTENPDDLSRWRESPPKDCKTSYRRRTLANWITDTEDGAGQLLARVIVNRLWQQYFGRGIVATPNDFGRQGPPPTHPELLDWLAAELIRHDWHLKPIHKLLATSSVYRQSSRWNDAWGAIDPENRWLWRWEPRRLTAEGIRDSILAVSGRLDRTFYGPGTLDPDHTRRSIYFMIKRSQLVPMMQLFDQPEPLVSVGRRPSTTIAPQALLFMNGQQVRVSAEAFANQLQPASVSESALVQAGYLQALGRPPTPAEVDLGVEFLSAQAESYRSRGIDHPQQQAAIDFCQALLGLNEFVYLR